MSVLPLTYTPVQGGSPNKRGRPFCMVVLTRTIRPKLKHIKLCVRPRPVQSYLGLDLNSGSCQIADVRSQPADNDPGYEAAERQGQGPDTAAIVGCLLLHRELIEACGMVYMIVDNRAPEEVGHWPAFAQWREARRALVGPQQERTHILWVQATHANGLRGNPLLLGRGICLGSSQVPVPQSTFWGLLTMTVFQSHSSKYRTSLL